MHHRYNHNWVIRLRYNCICLYNIYLFTWIIQMITLYIRERCQLIFLYPPWIWAPKASVGETWRAIARPRGLSDCTPFRTSYTELSPGHVGRNPTQSNHSHVSLVIMDRAEIEFNHRCVNHELLCFVRHTSQIKKSLFVMNGHDPSSAWSKFCQCTVNELIKMIGWECTELLVTTNIKAVTRQECEIANEFKALVASYWSHDHRAMSSMISETLQGIVSDISQMDE